jgi:hypothetical protein
MTKEIRKPKPEARLAAPGAKRGETKLDDRVPEYE